MKKIIFATLITVFGLSSCDFLDVKPKDKLDPDQYFRDEQDLKLFSNSMITYLIRHHMTSNPTLSSRKVQSQMNFLEVLPGKFRQMQLQEDGLGGSFVRLILCLGVYPSARTRLLS